MLTSGFSRYLSRKIAWYGLALIIAIALNFFLTRLIPGNPVQSMLSQLTQGGGVSSESLERLYQTYMREFGLDKPLHVQFFEYLGKVFRGDLGTSFMLYPGKVMNLIGEALPWTLGIQIPAILVGWLVGNILGALASYKGGKFDGTIFTTALVFSNIPYYGFAILLVYVFAANLGWFPLSGGYSMGMFPGWNLEFFVDVLRHWTLPFLSMILVAIGGQAIGMREMAVYELTSDYVNYSKALGLRDKKIVKYVFRNAMLPQITGLALSFGTMVGGALVTESVFSYPGMGSLLFSAIRQNDYPVIQGVTLIITLTVLLANFLVDIAYGFIDPRVRASQLGER
ncbi:MAG: ABC transporter permease [Firmicutes bacterium]|nr:ABC transporter permease [Bacillota bacterium]